MDLDRENLVSVDKLDQKRKLVARAQFRPEQRLASRVNELAERRAGKIAFVDDADRLVVIRQLPALGVIRLVPDRLVQHRPQSPSPPDQAAEDRYKSQGVKAELLTSPGTLNRDFFHRRRRF